jgi:hypothetical protein
MVKISCARMRPQGTPRPLRGAEAQCCRVLDGAGNPRVPQDRRERQVHPVVRNTWAPAAH